MGFFISLSFYVDAITQDLKTIISEIDDEIIFGSGKSSKPCPHKNNSSAKLSEAILLHNELFEYNIHPFSFA